MEKNKNSKIVVKDLNLWYGEKHALINNNIRIPNKQVTALIGPSGCGKSTFLRCLNRMNDLIEGVKITGEVLLDDRNIYDKEVDPVSLRKRVGMVFQRPNPFPMSVFDNVAYGPRIHGIKDRKKLEVIVEESLKGAALWDEVYDRLDMNGLDLSGGQQQRLCIARSIAVKPDIVLFDEPCSALDPIATGKIEDLIQELKKNYTIIIVTHNMQQAARVSDYTGFFLLGRLVEFSKTRKLFENPQEKETEDYITGRFG